jgi:predicted Zn finger-like uncharacterized protein
MSLLTRCPACETLYKLVPDQLRISQGWVKCGQCGEIFDASKHLIQVAVGPEVPIEPQPLSAATDGAAPNASPVIASAVPGVVVSVALEESAEATDRVDGSQAPTEASAAENEAVPLAETQSELITIIEPAPMDGEALDGESPSGFQDELQRSSGDLDSEPAPAQIQPALPASEVEFAKASFLNSSPHISVWHSRGGKFALWFAGIFLSTGLLFQWVYWERAYLAATYPNMMPPLRQMCQPLNCSVPSWQRIDGIAIESAAFNRLDMNSYRLSFAVKNLSKVVLALPSVELTLTDTQEQVIVRRVFSQQEIFATDQEFLPGAELPVVQVMQIDMGEATPHVVGYRLLAFYP